METDSHRRRRWFRLSLRTLFVVVAVLEATGDWVDHTVRLISERDAFYQRLRNDRKCSLRIRDEDLYRPRETATIPWLQTLLGDSPVPTIIYAPIKDKDGSELRRVRELFPEAHIWGWPLHGGTRDPNLPKWIKPLPDPPPSTASPG